MTGIIIGKLQFRTVRNPGGTSICEGRWYYNPKGDGWTAAEIKRLLADKACFRCHAFALACAQNGIDHRLTKPNRTIHGPTVKSSA